jgi:hypothetical protein
MQPVLAQQSNDLLILLGLDIIEFVVEIFNDPVQLVNFVVFENSLAALLIECINVAVCLISQLSILFFEASNSLGHVEKLYRI